MTVEDGLATEAIGHLGVGVVVFLIPGLNELEKVVHRVILAR
ncbi:hypothetical protein ACF059_15000 [Streptomyces sp. NPDC016562]